MIDSSTLFSSLIFGSVVAFIAMAVAVVLVDARDFIGKRLKRMRRRWKNKSKTKRNGR